MKFTHSLQFNSVPEWIDHYIDYGLLKKAIYDAEKAQLDGSSKSDVSIPRTPVETHPSKQVPLLESSSNVNFLQLVDKELEKVVRWYDVKSAEILERFSRLNLDSEQVATPRNKPKSHLAPSRLRSYSDSDREDNANERTALIKTQRRHSNASDVDVEVGNSNIISVDVDRIVRTRNQLKAKLIEIFVQLSEMKSFAELNWTGIRKGLKKYDKVTGNKVKDHYLQTVVAQKSPYQEKNQQNINEAIDAVISSYAKLATGGDTRAASRVLSSHLREQVVYERNTVWRDMVSRDRKANTVRVAAPPSPTITDRGAKLLKCLNRQMIIIPIALLVLILGAFFLPVQGDEARCCLAILLFASIMWCTEAIPLFVTALMIPLLAIVMRVHRDHTDLHRLSSPDATKEVFKGMFSPTIMLLLGGFTIAAALSKYHIAKLLATQVLSRAGTRPGVVLIANMAVATFLSMWISNVAAPVLCFSLIQPILRTLPKNSDFANCLIMGIALASNLGGMASPIASPQNLFALEAMVEPKPGWLQWFAVALPIVILSLFTTWSVLMLVYRPWGTKIIPIRPGNETFDWKHYFIMGTTLLVIALWCFEKKLEEYVGDMGVLAIVPVIAFFGTGILSKDDFNSFLWTVVFLAMGGTALGKAVDSSGLLHNIVSSVRTLVEGMNMWSIYITFTALVLVVATFISHTVSALVILPVVAQIGKTLGGGRANLLVFGAGLCCSAGMGLIVSGFPNLNAAMLEDEVGRRYLTTMDFLKSGVPASILVWLIIITVGYGLILAIGY
ncbi:hypothetical protein PROFUN_07925 [Planoprotostelium fungivorum]|uniref:SPX domain-containing protein n=1 Tax=Planoprotostelium fungivorum TaxID=1890364 RepID=A0A2P6NL31_9EUKA|nr:hypothetical protein PROFUN_07925 [Planoprotostelium fungivorum]